MEDEDTLETTVGCIDPGGSAAGRSTAARSRKPVGESGSAAKHAVLVARISAGHSPERTTVTATAEGVVNGIRKTIPLKVIPLSTAGTFAVTREWPEEGTWAVKMIATNPDYKDYATARW